MRNQIAQINFAPDGGFKGPGDKGLLAPPGNGIDIFARFISSTIGIMTIVAILYFILNFFVGAIGIIKSGGDKAMLETAREKIIHSIFGITVVVAAIFLVNLVGFFLGFTNILDIGAMLNLITGTK